MKPSEIERRLAALPVVLPEPDRERLLLDAIRDAERAAQSASVSQRLGWWQHPIPLWQAAAVVAALALIDLTWIRPARPEPCAAPLVAVRIDRDLFAGRQPPGEPFDVSRWETRVTSVR